MPLGEITLKNLLLFLVTLSNYTEVTSFIYRYSHSSYTCTIDLFMLSQGIVLKLQNVLEDYIISKDDMLQQCKF